MQPFVVAATLAAGLLLLAVSRPALAGAVPGGAGGAPVLAGAWLACFALAFAVQVRVIAATSVTGAS